MDSADKQGESLEPPAEQQNAGANSDGESLEGNASAEQGQPAGDAPESGSEKPKDGEKPKDKPKKSGGPLQRFRFLNIYLLLFLLVVLIGIIVLVVSIQLAKKESGTASLDTQSLSPEDINNISGNDVNIGQPDQVLRVKSNAVFEQRLLVQSNVEVAGSLKVNSFFSTTDINVTGKGSIKQADVDTLAVTGNASVQGQLTVQGTANITGGASFGGPISAPQLTIQTLQLNKDLKLNGHIDAGGTTPGRSNGSLGGGGTSSNSGTDTAGSVSINTGSGPGACLVTLSFTRAFNATPHVVISPTSSDAASLNYYVQRTSSSFTICGTNAASSKTYTFDYIVID